MSSGLLLIAALVGGLALAAVANTEDVPDRMRVLSGMAAVACAILAARLLAATMY